MYLLKSTSRYKERKKEEESKRYDYLQMDTNVSSFHVENLPITVVSFTA